MIKIQLQTLTEKVPFWFSVDLESEDEIKYCFVFGIKYEADFAATPSLLKHLDFLKNTYTEEIIRFETEMLEECNRVAECEKKDVEPYK